mmetsp:Transcript_103028/g.307746  ORF Transcript_103028/g.307746 Transcript_103028/m.307746 type:complete len:202 (+) Transcript_103028:330-935(+)
MSSAARRCMVSRSHCSSQASWLSRPCSSSLAEASSLAAGFWRPAPPARPPLCCQVQPFMHSKASTCSGLRCPPAWASRMPWTHCASARSRLSRLFCQGRKPRRRSQPRSSSDLLPNFTSRARSFADFGLGLPPASAGAGSSAPRLLFRCEPACPLAPAFAAAGILLGCTGCMLDRRTMASSHQRCSPSEPLASCTRCQLGE